MSDFLAQCRLTREERRRLDRIAAHRGIAPEVLATGLVKAYLALLRDAPEVLPDDPVARLCRSVK